MTTIFKLKNANFNNNKLPNIFPFVAIGSLDFAYNFSERESRLEDFVSGSQATAYKNDIKAGIIRQPDPTIVKTTDDGLGIKVEMGYLKLSDDAQINLSDEFTIMVAGGYSGDVFPSEKVAVIGPYICMLLDFGSGVGKEGLGIQYQQNKLGASINSTAVNLGGAINTKSQKSVLFITYKSGVWTLFNKTTEDVQTTTNDVLGVSGVLGYNSTNADGVSIGHTHKAATTGAFAPVVYAAAKWGRVLNQQEMEAQYKILKGSVPHL